MEYRAQPLTYKETLHFVTQVLLALHHAHEKGIVHRDVKPQNIMLLLSLIHIYSVSQAESVSTVLYRLYGRISRRRG